MHSENWQFAYCLSSEDSKKRPGPMGHTEILFYVGDSVR